MRHVAAHPARLVILGDGPLRVEMQQAAKTAGVRQHIHFAGFIPDPLPWIAHASALLLTSRYEGFGNVIVEALGLWNARHCHELSVWAVGNPGRWGIWPFDSDR